MLFFLATGLALGLGLGSVFRVLILVPVQLMAGAAIVAWTLSHATTVQQGFLGFAAMSVALQLGYLASAAMPVRARASRRAIRSSPDRRSDS